MVRAKFLSNRETVILEDGKHYLFDMGGVFYKEEEGIPPKFMDGMVEFDIVSILSSSGGVEVMLYTNDNAERVIEPKLNAVDCALKAQMLGGFTKMLRRDGNYEGIRYNQLVLLYTKGSSIPNQLLNELG